MEDRDQFTRTREGEGITEGLHHGRVDQVVAARQSVMAAAYQAHPERFAPSVRFVAAPIGSVMGAED